MSSLQPRQCHNRAQAIQKGHQCIGWFDRFSGSLHEKRWFCVYDFVKASRSPVGVLRDTWCERRFVYGTDKRFDDSDGREFRPSDLTKLLADPLFATYTTFVRSVGTIIQDLASYLETCPCHANLLTSCRAIV